MPIFGRVYLQTHDPREAKREGRDHVNQHKESPLSSAGGGGAPAI